MNSLLNYDLDASWSDPCRMDLYFTNPVSILFEEESDKANHLIGNTDSEKNNRQVEADGGWKCIHLGIREFISQIHFVIKELNLPPDRIACMRFLDVGCGVGQKVFMARTFGFQSHGLELRPELITAGERLFNRLDVDRANGCSRFIQGNALTYPDYNRFDIIYFYQPIFKAELEIELEKKIVSDAKVGTIVLANLARHFGGHSEYSKIPEGWKRLVGFNKGCGQIFQKL